LTVKLYDLTIPYTQSRLGKRGGRKEKRRARSQMVLKWGRGVRQSMRTKGTHPLACYVSFETREKRDGWSKDVLEREVFVTHKRGLTARGEQRGGEGG